MNDKDKKEIKDILENVKSEFLEKRSEGLCSAFWGYYGFYEDKKVEDKKETYSIEQIFMKYLKKNTTTDCLQGFYWKKEDKKSRIEWLDKHIALNS